MSKNNLRSRQRGRLSVRMQIIAGTAVFAAASLLMLIVFNLGSVKDTRAYFPGDYKAVESGDWSDASIWEVYDGNEWEEASYAPGPEVKTVVISNSHTVTITEETVISNVVIDQGAGLVLESPELLLKKFHGKGGITCNGILNFNETILTGDGDIAIGETGLIMIGAEDGIDKKGESGNLRITGKKDFNKNAEYRYSGSVRQRTGNGLPAALRYLSFDNRYGVDLDQHFFIADRLTLRKGVVFTGKYSITLGASPLSTGEIEQVGGTVSGKIKRWYGESTNKNILFPVSDGFNGNLFSFSSENSKFRKGMIEMNFHGGSLNEQQRSPFDARQFIVGISGNGYFSASLSNGAEEGWLKMSSAISEPNANRVSWKITEKQRMQAGKNEKVNAIQNLICGPNPFNESFTIHFYSDVPAKATMQLVNAAGQQVYMDQMEIREGFNQVEYKEGSSLAPGNYIVRISNTSEIHTLKLVKE